jgi:uncharacterized protein
MAETILIIRRLLLLIIFMYVAIMGILYFLQDRIIFFGPGITQQRLLDIREKYPDVEEVYSETHDNYLLHGWLVHNDRHSENPSPLLIYFGGNTEEVSFLLEGINNFPNWKILLVNYRGYGLSEGSPGEKVLLADALMLYDEFSKRSDIDPDAITVMGRSLGCAVAIYLSANRELAASVLVSPFVSIKEVARNVFPFIPVRMLLRHSFDMLPYAGNAENPMLTIVGSDDTLIPMRHSIELFGAWEGKKELMVIEKAGHNDLAGFSSYWSGIRRFLERQVRDDRLYAYSRQVSCSNECSTAGGKKQPGN